MKGHAMETPKGDAKAGETAFKKKKCTICHAFGKKKMGPDLNEISKRANAEWLTKWLTDDKKTWKSHDPITMDLKKRVGYDKQKQKLPKLKKSEVADLVQFLMTK